MANLGVIVGSGISGLGGLELSAGLQTTPYGDVEFERGAAGSCSVFVVGRHGRGHVRLSNHVRHQANIWALRELGADAIVASTAVGVLDPAIELGVPILFDDLFFPSNRLPDGTLATFFDKPGAPGRGHWMPSVPFSPWLRHLVRDAASSLDLDLVGGGCYVHADGPRFNTATEHRWMRSLGGTAVSQTSGPEAVLAGELGIPYALVGFGVNYVSGIAGVTPSTAGELATYLGRHREVASRLAGEVARRLAGAVAPAFDSGPVFRVER